MTTRLKHRIPVRVRHYWKLLATCVAVVVGLVTLAGNVRITPVVTSQAAVKKDKATNDLAGRLDLFDASLAHSVTIAYDEADYQRMFDEYMATGEKEYVRADVTIDGTLIRDVGIRLKGNSTLSGVTHKGQTRSLREGRGGPGGQGGFPGGQGGFPGMPGGGGQNPGGAQGVPGGAQGVPGGAQGVPGGAQGVPGGAQGGQGMPGGMMGPGGFGRTSLDSSRPEELPWLMSFDEFAKGRRYQNRSEIAVRIAGMGSGGTGLNEAVSLAVLDAVGQPTQSYAYAGLRVNDRPVKARLLVDIPDDGYAESLGSGVLYKSLATGQFTYQGEDPTSYEDDFKQINNKGGYDLKPVIDLVKWVNEASDADFAAHLADHVDVESFAAYAAMQSLLLNFDDMAGPGKNYYLWYDLETEKFKVISWDHNLTFSGGGGGLPGGGRGGFGGFGGFGGGNKLKERFLAAEAFKPLYDNAYRTLSRKVYADRTAETALTRISATLATVAGADAAVAASDTERLRTLIQQQAAALAGT